MTSDPIRFWKLPMKPVVAAVILGGLAFSPAAEITHPGIAQYAAQLDAYQQSPDAWSELYRPRYHFTPFRYWQNDPNGLAWFNGEWHLFYQHYLNDLCGVSWGHAISADLVHWKHLPPAIPADKLGAIFSGSGVVDQRDTSGFFGGKPGYVGIYTYHQDPWESQGIAYSPDGRKFFSYDGNPVIPDLRGVPGQKPDQAFRDPKVFWHEPTKRWIMVVAGGTLRFFSSPNLREWTFESSNDNIHTECPDLFPLAVEGCTNEIHWLLSRGGLSYMLGEFDGHKFTPRTDARPMNYATDSYASQSWGNAPDGRRIITSWLYFWGYHGQWLGPEGNAQSVPVELALHKTAGGELQLRQTPVAELQRLRGEPFRLKDVALTNSAQPLPQARGKELEVIAEFDLGSANEVGLILAQGRGGEGTVIGYNRERGEAFLDRTRSGWDGMTGMARTFEGPLRIENNRVKLHAFLDRTSLELFAGDGLANISAAILPQPASDGVSVFAKGGAARLISLEVFPLKSIHPAPKPDAPARVDLWKDLTLIQGRERWLSARVWPSAGTNLQWRSADPAALEIKAQSGEWVLLKALKPGASKLTAALPDGTNATCEVRVLPDSLKSDVDFVFTRPGWAITSNGLSYTGGEPSWIVSAASAVNCRFSADVTLADTNSSAGLFLRCDGQAWRGHGFELRAQQLDLIHGARGDVTVGGRTVRGTLPQNARPLPVAVGKPIRLEAEWSAGRLRCRVDGAEAFDLTQPHTENWVRCLGLSAAGAVNFQNVRFAALVDSAAAKGVRSRAGKPDALRQSTDAPVSFVHAPRRTNDHWPLSDQANQGGWVRDEVRSDEFNGLALNTNRWFPNNPQWSGRPPTLFHPANVTVTNGELMFRLNQHGHAKLPTNFTHTAGFIVSRQPVLYGYFEAEMKLLDAPWVSGFWMSNAGRDWWTEIDICENCPGVPANRHDLNSNVHVFRSPPDQGNVTNHFARSKKYTVPFELQSDYHVWGLEWNEQVIRFYLDGVLFREQTNTHWHQPLRINFNNESNEWFGALPDDARLGETFQVRYFRCWSKTASGH